MRVWMFKQPVFRHQWLQIQGKIFWSTLYNNAEPLRQQHEHKVLIIKFKNEPSMKLLPLQIFQHFLLPSKCESKRRRWQLFNSFDVFLNVVSTTTTTTATTSTTTTATLERVQTRQGVVVIERIGDLRTHATTTASRTIIGNWKVGVGLGQQRQNVSWRCWGDNSSINLC